MTTRKVVKDPMPKGMNRGEAEDKRCEKLGELAAYRRDNGGGTIRSQVDGFAKVVWQCSVCDCRHEAPKETAAGYEERKCPHCRVTCEHERVIEGL